MEVLRERVRAGEERASRAEKSLEAALEWEGRVREVEREVEVWEEVARGIAGGGGREQLAVKFEERNK